MGSRMDEEKTSAFRALQDDERRLLKHCYSIIKSMDGKSSPSSWNRQRHG